MLANCKIYLYVYILTKRIKKKKNKDKAFKVFMYPEKTGKKNKIFVLNSALIKIINVRPTVSQSYFCFSNFLRKKGVEMREM